MRTYKILKEVVVYFKMFLQHFPLDYMIKNTATITALPAIFGILNLESGH
jgi:hypothetical protein